MFRIAALQDWNPFQFDALGLITLLGAEEISSAFGRLATNRYTRFLPTVGAYVFAANSFTAPIPGFQVYNIDDSIYTTDVPGWFSRWLLNQNVKTNATKFVVSYRAGPSASSAFHTFVAIVLGVLAHVPIIVLAALTGDWWGFACCITMAFSTLSRYILVHQNKRIMGENAESAFSWPGGDKLQRTFWILPTGDAVTIRASKGILLNCLLTTPKTKGPVKFWSRAVAWVAFGGLAVTLGMSSLFIQILVVVIVLTSTCAVVLHLGDDDETVGTRLKIERQEDHDDSDTRAEAYFKLGLSVGQKEDMLRWSLLPQKTNKGWWECYEHCEAKGPNGFNNWRAVQRNYAQYGKPEAPTGA